MEGYYHQRNKVADTYEVAMEMVGYMLEDILGRRVVGAFVHRIDGVPILFTHAGVGPDFHEHIHESFATNFTVDSIEQYINSRLVSSAAKCTQYPCKFKGEVFDSGPDRGGKGIGGP